MSNALVPQVAARCSSALHMCCDTSILLSFVRNPLSTVIEVKATKFTCTPCQSCVADVPIMLSCRHLWLRPSVPLGHKLVVVLFTLGTCPTVLCSLPFILALLLCPHPVCCLLQTNISYVLSTSGCHHAANCMKWYASSATAYSFTV